MQSQPRDACGKLNAADGWNKLGEVSGICTSFALKNRLARLRNSFGKQGRRTLARQSSVRATIRLPDKKNKKKLASAIVL